MAELYQLQEQEIPEAMGQLQESHNNLKKVADYCEGLYLQVRWMTTIYFLIPELSMTNFHLQEMVCWLSPLQSGQVIPTPI